MTVSLLSTILLEGMVVVVFGLIEKKPLRYLLFSSLLLNLITQPILWVLINVFFERYLLVLLITELFIWVFEGLLLFALPCNQLSKKHALFLSLAMNMTSFGMGLFLPF